MLRSASLTGVQPVSSIRACTHQPHTRGRAPAAPSAVLRAPTHACVWYENTGAAARAMAPVRRGLIACCLFGLYCRAIRGRTHGLVPGCFAVTRTWRIAGWVQGEFSRRLYGRERRTLGRLLSGRAGILLQAHAPAPVPDPHRKLCWAAGPVPGRVEVARQHVNNEDPGARAPTPYTCPAWGCSAPAHCPCHCQRPARARRPALGCYCNGGDPGRMRAGGSLSNSRWPGQFEPTVRDAVAESPVQSGRVCSARTARDAGSGTTRGAHAKAKLVRINPARLETRNVTRRVCGATRSRETNEGSVYTL